jgi:transketolase
VLSNGHGSMLHYALLHLTGYDLSLNDLKAFRQWGSKTPGHPEVNDTPGIETTTGPLGQGLANAVGMALAEKMLAERFNQPGHHIVDHHSYVFLGDGCLMEGISHEACSLAGTLALGKLIAFWDDNGISIDGKVEAWFSDDTLMRFRAYGWHVISDVDGHDADAVAKAIQAAKQESTRPTFIACKTVIGFGAPTVAGSAKAHGAPLGAAEVAATRQQLAWDWEPFVIPEAYQKAWCAKAAGAERQAAWLERWHAYQAAFPELATALSQRMRGDFSSQWQQDCLDFIQSVQDQMKTTATRKASQSCLDYFSECVPALLGGSADLSGSNGTLWQGASVQSANTSGRYLHYGVREFAMSAIMNGLALHGGFIPYGGTFLVFSDYARNAVRMAALMRQRVIFVYTHDSVALGEDGPTHQPIEHAASLRLIPHVHVWRPCDAAETAVAWSQALQYQGPSSLLLTRQNVVHQRRSPQVLAMAAKGGYVLREAGGEHDMILIATGSEVALAMQVAEALAQEGYAASVVSMPCVEVFLQQSEAYQRAVLPGRIDTRIAIEAGVGDSWRRFVNENTGRIISLDHFGASAPGEQLLEAYGFSVAHVLSQAVSLLKENSEIPL